MQTDRLSVKGINNVLYADQFSGADMGAKINAAVAQLGSAGGHVKIAAGAYSFSTQINLDNVTGGLWLEGDGAANAGALPCVQLIWTGTGVPISARSSIGVRLSNFQLVTNNASYNAAGIDFSHSAMATDAMLWEVDHIGFFTSGSAQYNPVINATKAIEGHIHHNVFGGNYVYAVQGIVGVSDYSNVISIDHNQFTHASTTLGDFLGMGESWYIENNTFELVAGIAPINVIGVNGTWQGGSFKNNWVGDVATASAFTLLDLANAGLDISGNFVSLNAARTQTFALLHSGSAGISIHGNCLSNLGTGFSLPDNTPKATIKGNLIDATNIFGGAGAPSFNSNGIEHDSNFYGEPLKVFGALWINGGAGLPAAVNGASGAVIVGAGVGGGTGGASTVGTLYIGDGISGYQFNFSKRTGSIDTALFQFKDSGQFISSGSITCSGGGIVSSAGGATITGGTISDTLKLTAAAPTVSASQVGLGSTTATSATSGSNGAVPAQVAGYLIINVAGTTMKVPYFNT